VIGLDGLDSTRRRCTPIGKGVILRCALDDASFVGIGISPVTSVTLEEDAVKQLVANAAGECNSQADHMLLRVTDNPKYALRAVNPRADRRAYRYDL
jgi:hypothetical protein